MQIYGKFCKILCVNAQNVDWTNLEYFLATAHGGSLSTAARALSVNHATVSRRIDRLEVELGVRLFTRDTRGYLLTAAGKELLIHARAIEREVLAIRRKVAGLDRRLEGSVRVVTVDDLAVLMMPALLTGFRELHPAVTVELDVRTELTDLGRLQADVAIRFGERPQDPNVVSRRIGPAPTLLYASTDYLRRHQAPRTPAEIAHHDVVMGSESMAGVAMECFMAKHAPPERIALRSNSMLTRRAAIAAGLGIGMLPPAIARSDRTLREIPIDLPPMSSNIWMAMHTDVRTNARVRAFADFTYDRLRADPVLFGEP